MKENFKKGIVNNLLSSYLKGNKENFDKLINLFEFTNNNMQLKEDNNTSILNDRKNFIYLDLNQNENKDKLLFENIINEYFTLENDNEIKNVLKLICLLKNNVSFTRENLHNFYQFLSLYLSNKKNLNTNVFNKIFDLLEIIYEKIKILPEIKYKNFYSFNKGNGINFEFNLNISVKNNDDLIINQNINEDKEFFIFFSFKNCDEMNESNIFSFEFGNKNINILLKNNSIIYQDKILELNENLNKILIKFDNKKKDNFIIKLNEKIEKFTLVKKPENLQSIHLFTNFDGEIYNIIGFLGTEEEKNEIEILFFNGNIENEIFKDESLKNTIYNYKLKNLSYKFFIFNPKESLVINNEEKKEYYILDISKNNKIIIKDQKTKLITYKDLSKHLELFGGFKVFTPFFEYLLNIEGEIEEKNKIFDRLLNIIIYLYNINEFKGHFNNFYDVVCLILEKYSINFFKEENVKKTLKEFLNLKNNNDKINNFFEYKLYLNNIIEDEENNHKKSLIIFNYLEILFLFLEKNNYFNFKELLKYFLNNDLNINFIEKKINKEDFIFEEDFYKEFCNIIPKSFFEENEKVEKININEINYWIIEIFVLYNIKLIQINLNNLSCIINYFENNNIENPTLLIIYKIILILYNKEENMKFELKDFYDGFFNILYFFYGYFDKILINNNFVKEEQNELILLESIFFINFPEIFNKGQNEKLEILFLKFFSSQFPYIESFIEFFDRMIFIDFKKLNDFKDRPHILKNITLRLNNQDIFFKFSSFFYWIMIMLNEGIFSHLNYEKNFLNSFFYLFNQGKIQISSKTRKINTYQRIDINLIDFENIYFLKKYKENIQKIDNILEKLNGNFKSIEKKYFYNYDLRIDLLLYLNDYNIKKLYKNLYEDLYLNNGFWFQKDIKKKYKILNFITNDFKKPLLYPILKLNKYIPTFSNKVNIEEFLNEKNNNEEEEKQKEEEEEENNEIKNEKKENYFFIKEFINSILTKENLINIILKRFNCENNKIKECCLIKLYTHLKGFLFFDDNFIYFFSYPEHLTNYICNEIKFKENKDNLNKCYGQILPNLKKNENKIIIIPKSHIKFIFKRKYYLCDTALEIYTLNGKNYYFNFNEEQIRNNIINSFMGKNLEFLSLKIENTFNINILHLNIGFCQKYLLDSYNILNNNDYLLINNFIDLNKRNIITNYHLLMLFNIFSNRSFFDLTQYPVFPWIIFEINDSENDKKIQYRELNKSIGINYENNEKSQERIKFFNENCNNLKNELKIRNEEDVIHPQSISKFYYYNTSYSNREYICYYLLRILPFSFLNLEFQKNLNVPSKLFYSYENTVKNILSQKNDIKELIPEFYFLPELFENINNFNFNYNNNNKEEIKVNNVLIPKKIPYNRKNYENLLMFDNKSIQNLYFKFIVFLNREFENNEITLNLKNWIDMIFGVKQKFDRNKKESIANTFRPESYIDNPQNKDIQTKEKEKFLFDSCNLGLIPNQILKRFCPDLSEKENELNFFDNSTESFSLKFPGIFQNKIKNEQNIIKFTNPKLINFFVFNKNQIFIIDLNYKIKTSNFQDFLPINFSTYGNFYMNKTYFNNLSATSKKYKFTIFAGFDNGYLVYYSFIKQNRFKGYFTNFSNNKKFSDYKHILTYKDLFTPISSIEIIEEPNIFLLCGNLNGDIIIYELNKNNVYEKDLFANILNVDIIRSHSTAVNSIKYNKELNLIISTSLNGIINVYTFNDYKLVKGININSNLLQFAYLSSNPIPCIIYYCDNNKLASLPLNKEENYFELKNENYSKNLTNPTIFKDLKTNEDCLMCLSQNRKDIFIFTIPEFNLIKNNFSFNRPIQSYDLSYDLTTIIGLGNENVSIQIIKTHDLILN